ncbi:hypothetical protein FIBSPDRAFT_912406 [Athelia psychrophila]|uniref:RNA-dependent RNA polymerase n=1 Tax=Athelia psychrophila TaxID=1759441 RepID=A0A166EKH3_9AGAM|nr:hypothetical protein FIBSPDRAFT_912406 [Fibularhizoctonia sp. CBS 109695]
MDDKHISWGVQWEIARGAIFHTASGQFKPRWTWSDVTSRRLDKLRGLSTAAAWKVPYVMLDKEIPTKCPSNLDIWRELDREQLALLEGKGRGLGLMGSWQDTPNWYGGQIQQICRLNKGSDGFYVTLEALEKTRSYRFARYMGSRRLLQMRIDIALLQRERDDAIQFLTRDFVVCGRIFRGFTSREDSVYLIETNRDHQRVARDHEGDKLRLSYGDFIQWHNPLDRNSRQAISKWAARWALGLSTSRPVLELEEHNIMVIDDVYSPDVKPGEKASAEKTMTDGCGLMNGAALTGMYKSGVVNLPHKPSCVQARVTGAKGMWLEHPTDDSTEPKIWIRRSQKKISLPTPLDRSHRIFELICPSRVVAPSHLNMQVISNMSHNEVPDKAFSSLINEDLQATIKPLTNWSASHLLIGVAKAVHQTGRIHGTRLQRVAPASTRALGLALGFHREEVVEADVDEESPFAHAFNAAPPGRCQFSGAPISVHENAYELLAAGFHPLRLEHLYQKMHSITKMSIDTSVKQYRITIMQSLEAFILPDPTGALEEGQLYFRSSQSLADPETGSVFTILLGDVIVIAVDCVALRDYYDVIIFSIKGKRSLASLLAGGDTAMLFWAKWLVDTFKNSPPSDPPPRLVDQMFTRDVKSVTEFSKELEQKTATEAHTALRQLAFMGLVDSKVGLLSNCHDIAVYKHGYGSEKAQYVAHVFNTAMDAQKSGLRLEPTAFKQLQRQYGGRRPDCMVHTEPSGKGFYIIPESTGAPPKRDISQTTFVLDHLVKTGDALRNKHLSEFEKPIEGKRWQRDQDLMAPYLEAQRWASMMTKDRGFDTFEEELQVLELHVKKVYEAYGKFWGAKDQSPSKPTTITKRRKKGDSASSTKTEFARQYVEGPEGQSDFLTRDLARIKASCAYANSSAAFAFSVAFKELCQIKVKASGHYVPTIGTMSEAMAVQSSFVRLYDERVDEF